MASSALRKVEVESEVESFERFKLIAAFARPLTEASFCDPPAFTQEADGLSVSTRQAVGCVKGAMLVVGVEAAATLTLFGIWQLWRFLR